MTTVLMIQLYCYKADFEQLKDISLMIMRSIHHNFYYKFRVTRYVRLIMQYRIDLIHAKELSE